jgi:hypothetical protein
LDYSPYDILIPDPNFFNFVGNSKIRFGKYAFIYFIKYLAKRMKFRPFYYIIKEISYDDKNY